MKILITSGGTKVPLDDVRHIGNMSTGRYGAEIAESAINSGHEVIFFHEKGSVKPIWQCNLLIKTPIFVEYKDYNDYLRINEVITEYNPDMIISAAAVSDFITDKVVGKISSTNKDEITFTLKKGPKIISTLKATSPDSTLVGFKLLVNATKAEMFEAVKKLFKSGTDYVIFNDLSKLRRGDTKRLVFSKETFPSYEVAKDAIELLNLIQSKNEDTMGINR